MKSAEDKAIDVALGFLDSCGGLEVERNKIGIVREDGLTYNKLYVSLFSSVFLQGKSKLEIDTLLSDVLVELYKQLILTDIANVEEPFDRILSTLNYEDNQTINKYLIDFGMTRLDNYKDLCLPLSAILYNFFSLGKYDDEFKIESITSAANTLEKEGYKVSKVAYFYSKYKQPMFYTTATDLDTINIRIWNRSFRIISE